LFLVVDDIGGAAWRRWRATEQLMTANPQPGQYQSMRRKFNLDVSTR
jgi:hypothetical protein